MSAEPLVIACAADRQYALPLAVMLRSVVANLDSRRTVKVYVVDSGLDPGARSRISASLTERVTLHWIAPERTGFIDLPLWGRMTIATYDKLTIGRWLPESEGRVLWLDCDLLVVPASLARNASAKLSTKVSFPKLQASNGEVIGFFQVRVTAGAFLAISNLPIGWYLDINNKPSWQTEVKGNTIVGSASLSPDELNKMKFLIQEHEIGDLKFDLTADVSFTTDYEKWRVVHLKTSDFLKQPRE